MKIAGIDLKARPYKEITLNVLGTEIPFKLGIADMKQLPIEEPKPPYKVLRDGSKVPDTKDKVFLKKMEEYGVARMVILVMRTFAYTEGLEWETLDEANVETLTLENITSEMVGMGLPDAAANRLIQEALSVNGLTEELVSTARKSFLPPQEDAEQ